MQWESLRPDLILEDAKEQYRTGKRVEQYRLSEKALFLPRQQYIPLKAMEKIQIRKGMLHSGHCCGMGIPVSNLVIFYGGEKPAKLMLEKQKNAVRLAELLTAAEERIVWEAYVPPYEQQEQAGMSAVSAEQPG